MVISAGRKLLYSPRLPSWKGRQAATQFEMAAYCSKRLEYSGAHSRICVVDVRYPLLSVSRGSHSEQQCVSRSCDGGWFKGRSRGAYSVRKRVLVRIRWHASLARSWVCHHPAGARTAARCPFNVRWQWNESQAELQSNLVDSQSPKTHKKPNLNLNLLSQLPSWSLQGPGTCGSSWLLVNGARIQIQSEYSVYGRKRASVIVAVNHLALPRTLAR